MRHIYPSMVRELEHLAIALTDQDSCPIFEFDDPQLEKAVSAFDAAIVQHRAACPDSLIVERWLADRLLHFIAARNLVDRPDSD